MAASGAQAPTANGLFASQITSSTEPNALVQPAASAAYAWQLTRRQQAAPRAGCAPPCPPSLHGLQPGSGQAAELERHSFQGSKSCTRFRSRPSSSSSFSSFSSSAASELPASGGGPAAAVDHNQLPQVEHGATVPLKPSAVQHAVKLQPLPCTPSSQSHLQSRATAGPPGPTAPRPLHCPQTWVAPWRLHPAPALAWDPK